MFQFQLFRRCLICLLLLSLLACGFCACEKEPAGEDDAVYYTVTFNSNGGSAVASKQIASGQKVPEPPEPKKEGFMFGGWLKKNIEWDFATRTVIEDITLEAKWISLERVFSYEKIEGTDTVRITELKQTFEEITVPTLLGGFSVAAIGDEVFADLSSESVKKITVPAGITSIGKYAFLNLSGISIEFEEGCVLTSLGEEAFSGCDGLKSISLGEGLTSIPAWCFSGCKSLREIRLPKSVGVIAESAFDGCASLLTVMMHANVTAVEDSAFDDCEALKTLFFYGSSEELELLLDEKLANLNDALLEATPYLYSESKPSTEGEYGYWYLDENRKAKIW